MGRGPGQKGQVGGPNQQGRKQPKKKDRKGQKVKKGQPSSSTALQPFDGDGDWDCSDTFCEEFLKLAMGQGLQVHMADPAEPRDCEILEPNGFENKVSQIATMEVIPEEGTSEEEDDKGLVVMEVEGGKGQEGDIIKGEGFSTAPQPLGGDGVWDCSDTFCEEFLKLAMGQGLEMEDQKGVGSPPPTPQQQQPDEGPLECGICEPSEFPKDALKITTMEMLPEEGPSAEEDNKELVVMEVEGGKGPGLEGDIKGKGFSTAPQPLDVDGVWDCSDQFFEEFLKLAMGQLLGDQEGEGLPPPPQQQQPDEEPNECQKQVLKIATTEMIHKEGPSAGEDNNGLEVVDEGKGPEEDIKGEGQEEKCQEGPYTSTTAQQPDEVAIANWKPNDTFCAEFVKWGKALEEVEKNRAVRGPCPPTCPHHDCVTSDAARVDKEFREQFLKLVKTELGTIEAQGGFPNQQPVEERMESLIPSLDIFIGVLKDGMNRLMDEGGLGDGSPDEERDIVPHIHELLGVIGNVVNQFHSEAQLPPSEPAEPFVMDMDPEYLTGEDAVGPTKVEMDQFLKKFKMLTKTELEAALRVSPDDFVSVLNQMVPCVGCRKSAEAVFQQYQEGPSYGFYPLCMDEKGVMYLAKDKVTPKFLCSMFHCPSLKVQNLIDSLSKCKSGRRCALHSLESQRIRTVSSWVDVWDYMDEKCQQRTVMVDSKCLIETLERYLKKHRFCTECKSKVLRAYNILTGELDPASEPGFISQLYEGIECCKEDQHLHLMCKTEFVSRLIAKAVPELVGSSRRERHAKTMEIAQEEVLTCLGLCVFERLHRIQQRFREEERTWEIIMCTAIQALRRSFEVAVETKLGVSQLELLCQELNKEELAKQQRKERKKLNRKKKKEKKTEENTDSVHAADFDELEETAAEAGLESEPLAEEKNEEEVQEEHDSCQCEPAETAPSKTRKKKKAGKGKGKNKATSSSDLPLREVANSAVKSDPHSTAQKGSAASLCQESRCSSETSRDGGYSSESTSLNHDNTTCSSLEGSEIACADDCCRMCPEFINSENEPRIVQGPYRSLVEQLEEAGSSENEDPDWVPPEKAAIQTEAWGQEREQFRKTLEQNFNDMLSKRKAPVFRRWGDEHHTECCERDENQAPSKALKDPSGEKEPEATVAKKGTRGGNGSSKPRAGGQQNNRKYKGKNRR